MRSNSKREGVFLGVVRRTRGSHVTSVTSSDDDDTDATLASQAETDSKGNVAFPIVLRTYNFIN